MGPLITFSIFFVSSLPAVFAVYFWLPGHIAKLILDGKEADIPHWLRESVDKERVKPFIVSLSKGIAWTINIVWALFLLSEPGCGRWWPVSCSPIYSNIAFHNVALLDIGGIFMELVWFFIFMGLVGYDWHRIFEHK